MKNAIYLSGLPYSGDTLLANILSMHDKIQATPTSPLPNILSSMRKNWSSDPFLLSQLDSSFDEVYNRLRLSAKAFMETWSEHGHDDVDIVLEKSALWLQHIELLKELRPQFKLILMVRDLRQIYAEIEYQHRQTVLLDFPENIENNLVQIRLGNLFAPQGPIGSALQSMDNLRDIFNLQENIYVCRYEDLVGNPQEVCDSLLNWLDVPSKTFNFDDIKQSTLEADSYNHYKMIHEVASVMPAANISLENVSPRAIENIVQQWGWFYQIYYPEFFEPEDDAASNTAPSAQLVDSRSTEDDAMVQQLEQDIAAEANLEP